MEGTPRSSDPVEISVLIPVLDEEFYIRDAVARMREQDFEGGFELIFIDGRSTDRTREILEELAEEDPRIRVLDNPARRTPHALNVGLAQARADSRGLGDQPDLSRSWPDQPGIHV